MASQSIEKHELERAAVEQPGEPKGHRKRLRSSQEDDSCQASPRPVLVLPPPLPDNKTAQAAAERESSSRSNLQRELLRATYKEDVSGICYLVRQGAQLTSAALHCICHGDNNDITVPSPSLEVFKFLVEEAGYHPNQAMTDGDVALPHCVKNEAIVRYLLDHGADPNLGLAAPYLRYHPLSPPGQLRESQKYLVGGAALDAAAARGSPAIFQLLLDRGAHLAASAPLHAAAFAMRDGCDERERAELMSYLVRDVGVNIDQSTRGDSAMYYIGAPELTMMAPSPMLAATPLLTAVCHHLPRAAKVLLHLGATPVTEAQCQSYGARGLPDWYVAATQRVADVRRRTPSEENTLELGPATTHPSLWPWTRRPGKGNHHPKRPHPLPDDSQSPARGQLQQELRDAVLAGDAEMTRRILRQGAQLTNTIVFAACKPQSSGMIPSLSLFQVFVQDGGYHPNQGMFIMDNAWIPTTRFLSEHVALPYCIRDKPLLNFLLSHGADPNLVTKKKDPSGTLPPRKKTGTVVDAAAAVGTPAIFDLLLEYGMDASLGQPLHTAVRYWNGDVPGRTAMMVYLVRNVGMDVNMPGTVESSYACQDPEMNMWTVPPVVAACMCNNFGAVEVLLHLGARVPVSTKGEPLSGGGPAPSVPFSQYFKTAGFKRAVERVSEVRGGGSSDWIWVVTHPRLWPWRKAAEVRTGDQAYVSRSWLSEQLPVRPSSLTLLPLILQTSEDVGKTSS